MSISCNYEYINRTFDAFLSQTSPTRASNLLFIISVRIEIECIFFVIVKRISFSFKWCIILKNSKMRLATGLEQMDHI